MISSQLGSGKGLLGRLTPAQGAALHRWATRVPLVVETFDHALIPAYEATRRVLENREPEDTTAALVWRSLKASAFPLALGGALIGANLAITRRNPDLWSQPIFTGEGGFPLSRGHLLDLACGALLGFISGTVESLRPDWVGHTRHGHRDHGRHAHAIPELDESNGRRIRRALKEGIQHTGSHLVDDIKLLTVMRVFFGV